MIASEYLPDGFQRHLVAPLVDRQGKFEWLWPQVVMLYSAANLTFGKDKLPALSGIARLGHNGTSDQYLAGLWRGQIEEQLCWRRWRSNPTAKRPPWRAPTWSWASIDGRVSWHILQEGILEIKYAHVLDASTTNYGYDPFGQVSGGVIRLACSNMAAGYLIHSEKSNEPEAEEGTNILLHAGNEEQDFPVLVDCLDNAHQGDNGLIHLVPILAGRTGTRTGEEGKDLLDELMIEGLVLRATGVTKGEFSRIGCFNFYKNRSRDFEIEYEESTYEENTYEPFLQVLEEHGTATAEAACTEIISDCKNPDERYVITIILRSCGLRSTNCAVSPGNGTVDLIGCTYTLLLARTLSNL